MSVLYEVKIQPFPLNTGVTVNTRLALPHSM